MEKQLIEIASIAQEIINALVRGSGHKTVESFQLGKIVVGCGAVLETLNAASLFLKDRVVDDRLTDWLSSKEPRVCLDVLKQMQSLLPTKPDHAGHVVKNPFQASRSASAKDKGGEAIRLFQKNKACFHFLLTTEIWWVSRPAFNERALDYHIRDQQGSSQQRPPVGHESTPTRRPDSVIGYQRATQVLQERNANSVPRGKKTKRPRVNTKKLDLILEWLDPLKCGETYERTLLLRQRDTCTWLPKTEAFQTWKTSQNSFLWLHGKAGAGKSVLAASVIEGLKDSLQEGEVLALFYCDFRNERSTTAIEAMRSLLAQLLQQFPYHAVDPGDLMNELVKEKDGATSIISNGILLARYISRAATLFSQRPFIVVDALDECKDVERLLDALLELNKAGGVRLFLTSRPHLVIKNSFSDLPSISMDMMKHAVSHDIKLHVTREVDSHLRLRVLDHDLKEEVHTQLCHKADGMFRWVQCQLNVLKGCVTAAQVREALCDLPTDLNETYERILSNASKDKQGSQVVQRALNWLVAALAPMYLSQLVEGLSIDLERQTVDRNNGPAHGTMLLDVLGSLVAYNEGTDIIILSHFSVKEYLTEKSSMHRDQSVYYVNEQDAHEHLALCSMCYLCIHLRQLTGHEELHSKMYSPGKSRSAQPTIAFCRTGRPQLLFEHHTLLEYVESHGLLHLAHINPRKKSILKAIETLRSVAQQYSLEWEQFCETAPIWPTLEHDIMLYILIAFAPQPLLGLFLGRAQLKLKDGTNPLIYAAHFRKIEHARTLLSRGVNVNCSGWNVYSRWNTRRPHQVLPIEVTLQLFIWDLAMFEVFLNGGGFVPYQSFNHLFDKHCNTYACLVSRLVQTDEFAEWAVNAEDQSRLPLALDFNRYSNGCPSEQEADIIRHRLVQIGCESLQLNETSLRQAVSAGHVFAVQTMLSKMLFPYDIILDASGSRNSNTEMLCVFLSKGCSVNVVSQTGKNPLHLLMEAGLPEIDCLESVEVLTTAGCDPSACDLSGKTPLHLAVAYGYTAVVEYLLSTYVPLPPDVLLTEGVIWEPALVQLLVREGASVQIAAASGDTPLHLVLYRNPHDTSEGQARVECLQILVDAGCNPFLLNAHGKTSFDIAAEHDFLPVMEYLLSLWPNIPFSQDILLSVICGTGQLALSKLTPLVKLLIELGADINVHDSYGNTLLHRTMLVDDDPEKDLLRMVEILISAGCDPHACNLAGETLYHAAARRRAISVMEYLLTLGVSVPSNIRLGVDWFIGSSSLSRTCAAIKFLCGHGGDIHTRGENGDTLLHQIEAACPFQDENYVLGLAKFLVGAGCNPNTLDSNHESSLHSAARGGYKSVVEYFLSLELPLPRDILLSATSSSQFRRTIPPEMIRYLINKGADISLVTKDGDGPLHLLLNDGWKVFYYEEIILESVRILVDAGCDPCSKNRSGKTPLHNAASSGLVAILKYFLEQGCLLPYDVLRSSTPKTMLFILNELPVTDNLLTSDEELMHRAIDYDDSSDRDHCLECVKSLIGIGYKPTFRSACGETPMHVAARRQDRLPVIIYLLSQNVPLPTDVLLAALPPDDKPWSAEGRIPLLNLLIREGARTNVANSNGDTPLHFAVRRDFGSTEEPSRYHRYSWELVRILLENGSNPNARNSEGETPCDLAAAKGHLFQENFLRLVRKYGSSDPRTLS